MKKRITRYAISRAWPVLVLLFCAFGLCSSLNAQVNTELRQSNPLVERYDYAQIQDHTTARLDAAAAQLAQVLDSAFQIQDFRVFDFGLYLPSLSMKGELSFEEAVSNMYNRIETGGVIAFRNPNGPVLRSAAPPRAYVLITHQYQGGGNVRFDLLVKIPGLLPNGAAAAEMEKTLQLAGQRAVEQAYVQNPGADKVAAAKAEGLRAIMQLVQSGDKVNSLSSGGLKLKEGGLFVTFSGKVIALEAGDVIYGYCGDQNLTNGILVGFKKNGITWTAKTAEINCPNCSFSGYHETIGESWGSTVYESTNVVTVGNKMIYALNLYKRADGLRDFTLIRQLQEVKANHIQGLGSTFAGPKVANPFTFNTSLSDVISRGSTTTLCDGGYPQIKEIKPKLLNSPDMDIFVENEDKGFLELIDENGLPKKVDKPSNAKIKVFFTKKNNKITDARVELSEQNKPAEATINEAIGKLNKQGPTKHTIPVVLIDETQAGEISADLSDFMQAVTVVADIGVNIYEEAKMPGAFWDKADPKNANYPVHAPPLLCGSGDAVLDEVTGTVQLVKMGVDLVSEPQQIVQVWESIKTITPAAVFNAAKDGIKQKWANYTGTSTTPKDSIQYEAGTDAVKVVTALFAAGTLLSNADDLIGGMKKTAGELLKETDELFKRLVEQLKDKSLQDILKKDLSLQALKDYLGSKLPSVNIWEYLHKKGKSKARLDPKILENLGKLPDNLRELISDFTDETLAKFCLDLDDPAFLEFVQHPDNLLVVRGFLMHKDILSDDELETLVEMIERSEITNPKALSWLERGKNLDKYKKRFELGKAFEKAVKDALKNVNSVAYQKLKEVVSDLDQRTILSQVYFCINGRTDCNAEGEYFIADFVLVKNDVDELGNPIQDVIIVDTKLSESTSLTKNQKKADVMSNLIVKTDVSEAILNRGPSLLPGATVRKNGSIRKMWSDGNGQVQNVN
jgi:hypothetical protein